MDFSIMSAPRISAHTFAVILERGSSPAAPEAAACYAAAVALGVDPAVLLAVFQHESSYGRAGVAASSHSWGNLRTSPSYPSVDGFARYPTWTAGAADTARLLRVYGLNRIRPGTVTSSCLTFPFVWAPAADHNKPAAYGAALVRSIGAYLATDEALRHTRTTATHANVYRDVRIRAAASTLAPIVATVQPGAQVRADRIVRGRRYTVPDGRTSDRWLRIVARDGHALARPVYSAAILWRTL